MKRCLTFLFWLFFLSPSFGQDLYLGMSASFTGPNRSLGIELYRGSLAYLNKINAQGGVEGRKLKVLAYDDKYDPELTLKNTYQLVDRDKVLLLFNYVGTPTTTKMLPFLVIDREHFAFLFFPFTGSMTLRIPPYNHYVFHFRPSYAKEIRTILNKFLELGVKRIGVFYQLDAFGRTGWQSAVDFLKEKGLRLAADASYLRGMGVKDNYLEQVEIFKKAQVEVILNVASTEASVGFIRDLRDAGVKVPVANLSFVDPQYMFLLLKEIEKSKKRYYSYGLLNSLVLPFYEYKYYLLYQEYLADMIKYTPKVEENYLKDYKHPFYGPISLEGYLNAKLIVEVIKRLGSNLDKSEIYKIVSSSQGFDIGLDKKVFLFPGHKDFFEDIFFITIKNDMFEPIKDFRKLFY